MELPLLLKLLGPRKGQGPPIRHAIPHLDMLGDSTTADLVVCWEGCLRCHLQLLAAPMTDDRGWKVISGSWRVADGGCRVLDGY